MTSTPRRCISAICSQMAPSRVRDGRPSSLATTEVPALMRMRRALRRALRESGSVDMTINERLYFNVVLSREQ